MHIYYDISPWSPDGRRIVFASHEPGFAGPENWIMDADSRNKRRVTDILDFNPHSASSQKWSDNRTVVLPLGDHARVSSTSIPDPSTRCTSPPASPR